MKAMNIIIATIVLLSCFAITGQASQGESKVKTNANLATDRVLELQTKDSVYVEKAQTKSMNERGLYKYEIADINEDLTISASLDSSSLVCGRTPTGEIKIKDLGKDHKLRDIRIKASDLSGLPGIDKGIVKITHFNDAGLPDAVWVQQVINNNGYVYFEEVPFSEIVIGGFIGDYEKTGLVTYQTSQTFGMGSTFDAAEVNYLEAEVTPTYTESSPYEVPTDGLVGFWKFDEGEGVNVTDSSGNGNNGIASGGMNWTDGKLNYAGEFDNSNDGVTVHNTGSLLVVNSTGLSSFAWVYHKGEGEDTIIHRHSDTVNAQGTLLLTAAGSSFKYLLTTSISGFTTQTAPVNTVPLNQWVFIGATYDGNNIKMYCNGELVKTKEWYGLVENNTIPTIEIGKEYSTGYFNGSIDNVMIYNRSLSEAEIKQIYYDSLNDVQFKTNSNTEYSTAIDSGSVSIPYDSTDEDITSLTATVPENVTIGGVTVRDYTKTVTPFTVSATVGYTEDTTLISEELTDTYYQIVIKHTPCNDYNQGTVSYTSDNNAILQSSYLTYSMTSTNPNAVLSYNGLTRKWTISTGAITGGTTYSYNIIASLTGTPVLEVQDGIGDEHVETYPETGNTTTAIGSTFTCVGNDGGWTDGSDIWNTTASLLIVVIVIIFGGLAIQKLRGVTNYKGDDN